MCPASTVREVKSLVILMLASMLCRNPKGRDHTAVVNADVGIQKLCEDRALNMVRRINKWPFKSHNVVGLDSTFQSDHKEVK